MDPLVTPQQLEEYTKGAIRADDPRAALLLAGASAAVRRFCGWHITPVLTQTMTLDGPGGADLELATLNLEGIVSVVELGQALDVTALEWSRLGNIRHPRGCWSSRYRSIVVSIRHGFDDAADVQQIVLQVSASALSSPMGVTREQAGQVAVQWATTAPGVSGGVSLLQRDLDVLALYRLNKRS